MKVLRKAQQSTNESSTRKSLMHANEVMWHKENGGTTWDFKSRLNNQEGYAQDVIYHS